MRATIVTDLGFGDAGKGTIVDFLARQSIAPVVVRFNGGAQAAHNVITPEGAHHTFAQFGSGSLVRGTRTHLSRFVAVDPFALITEAEHLIGLGVHDIFARLSVDRDARVVTPLHKAGNRIREVLRGGGRHGSCGMGVGEMMADAVAFPHRTVTAADLRSPETLVEKLRFFQKLKADEFREQREAIAQAPYLEHERRLVFEPGMPERIARALWEVSMRFAIVEGRYLAHLARDHELIFEGAQGILLDEWHGFHPYTTWSTTTTHNARTLLAEIGYVGAVRSIGVTRAYATRHGPGPFPAEDASLVQLLPEPFNGDGRWQGAFRTGWLDTVLLRYACTVSGGIDELAVTHLDRVRELRLKVATSYALGTDSTRHERVLIKPGNDVLSLRAKSMLTDLAFQESLTRLLGEVAIRYTPVVDSVSALLARELGVPVTIESRGPTALDKSWVSVLPCASAA